MDKDLFGFKTQGKLYDAYRPQYPKEQLQATLKRVSRKHKYLDIATGTGQILFELAKEFG
jgi:ubiquinone/menaquinone biosynthesis C-methylase UbiE